MKLATLREWILRYGVAECFGITFALLASFGARRLTGNPIVIGYITAWGETLGYLGLVVVRDFVMESRLARKAIPTVPTPHARVRTPRQVLFDLVAEFGPAGVVDTLFTRPLAMSVGIHTLGVTRGVVVGQLTADVVFYIPVVIQYERRKRARRS
ncbi:MAG: hypothetical protein ABI205_05060 [Gemmatimonadaceae bacterium]